MIGRVTFFKTRQQPTSEQFASSILTNEVRQWLYVICLPVIGLLALVLFLYFGGAFAFIGPWVIVIGAHLIAKRLKSENWQKDR